MGNRLKEARDSKIANFHFMVLVSSAGVVLSAYGQILSEQLNTHIIELKNICNIISNMKITHLDMYCITSNGLTNITKHSKIANLFP